MVDQITIPIPDLVVGKALVEEDDPLKPSPWNENENPENSAEPRPGQGTTAEKEDKAYGFPTYFAVCFFIVAVCSATGVVLWSNMGIGEDTLKFLADEGWMAYVFGGVLVFLLSVLYLADFFWPPHLPGQYLVLWPKDPCFGKILLFVCVVCFIFACLFCAEDYPSVPLLITIFLSPALILFLRVTTNPRTGFEDMASPEELAQMEVSDREKVLRQLTGSEGDSHTFYRAAMLAYFLGFIITLAVWIPWALQQTDDFEKMKSSNASKKEKEKLYIMWCVPLGVACSNLAFFILVLVRVVMAKSYEGTNEFKNQLIASGCSEKVLNARLTKAASVNDLPLSEEKRQQYLEIHKSHLRQLSKIIKIIGTAILMMLGTFYVAAELVAADSQIALMFQGFLGCFFLTFFAFIFVSFRRLLSSMSMWLQEMPLYRMAKSISENDWMKAVGVASCLPAIPGMLVISALNQALRKCRGKTGCDVEGPSNEAGCGRADDDAREASSEKPQETRLTVRVQKVVEAARNWDWLAMTFKLYALGILMVIYVLSPRILNVFLAWLKSVLTGFDFSIIVVMVWLSGMCCFLLPPVPGVPVYIFGGMIVADQCPSGFWPGIGICIVLSFFMKICACAMQQKLIGETLGSSIAIQQQSGIHKPGIRAIECVLRMPGWSIGKVAILCGGPDWPTSVMAGVLRLPVSKMLFGTIPIIFFVAPCVMTGSFYLKQDESEMWSRSGTLMMTLTMVVNMILWALAGWAIQEQFDKNHEKITRPMETYLELDWRDYKEAELATAKVIKFEDVPWPLRYSYVYFMVVVIMVCQFFYWTPTTCFGEFPVTGDIKKLEWAGENGLFKTPGIVGCGITCFCCLVCWSFGKWKALQCKAARMEKAAELAKFEEEWKTRRREQCEAAKAAADAGGADPADTADGDPAAGREGCWRRACCCPRQPSDEDLQKRSISLPVPQGDYSRPLDKE